MNHSEIINLLEQNASVFKSLLFDAEKDLQQFRYHPEKWNLLEIVCHLYDEEREDFRARVKHVLHTPAEPLPGIDPVKFVKERNYASKDYSKTLSEFLDERRKSVEWLRGLKNPHWKNAYVHPKFGPFTAEFLLANWVAHDYLHFRQVARNKYEFLKHRSGVHLGYAGNW